MYIIRARGKCIGNGRFRVFADSITAALFPAAFYRFSRPRSPITVERETMSREMYLPPRGTVGTDENADFRGGPLRRSCPVNAEKHYARVRLGPKVTG